MFGYAPPAIPTAFENTHFPNAEERLTFLTRIRNEALAAHELAKRRMATRIKSTYKPFEENQLVWLEAKNLRLGYNKKISTKREGPFKITEVMGPVTYRLQLPPAWKIHDVFHAVLLTPHTETDIHGPSFPKPPAELIEDEPEWEVDRILRHRKRNNKFEYHVLWKGYPITEATWEPEENLERAQDVIADYKIRKKIYDDKSNTIEQTKQSRNPSTSRARTRRKRT